ncbi:MAG TPA: adenosylmethionine--8-amino-7-oxononanoate transaminase [Pseudomonadales bacterium]|nr:adenosylmethionine--8-amino-7-oxononanoate transaminase [Pseudomonadales bacterium]
MTDQRDPHAIAALLAADRRHAWHPYASALNPPPVYPVASARGVRLQLADGRELLDGMSSWWAAIHGYNHPVLNRAVSAQLGRMSHMMFGGLTNEPAVELCALLAAITPGELERVFLCDSGSVAVEVAIKMALQYWQARGQPGRNRLLTLAGGYHGDTFMAMSVCDPVTGMHHLFRDVLPRQLFAPRPGCGFGKPARAADIAAFEALLDEHREQIAAVILEPIVQGAGGMHFYSADYLRRVRALCDAHGVLLIADEIATGFGRTGKLFACEHAGIAPDILCLGKALTGGYLSLAATLTSGHVAGIVCSGEAGALMHGPTFMGNPLACAVALASTRLLLSQPWQREIARLEAALRAGLAPAALLPGVREVRVLGAIGVIEMEQEVAMGPITERFLAEGVWIRPFGRLVYTMPPFIMRNDEVARLTHGMIAALEKYLSHPAGEEAR